jgi:hypothetical protein
VPRHRLLPDAELRRLLGIPADRDALARHFTLTPSDHDLVLTRRGAANRLGFAVQLALLRHSSRALAQVEEPLDALVAWIATQIHVPAHLFTDYARRPQTMTDHARQLAAMLGLRPSTNLDLPFMIEAAAQAAWTALSTFGAKTQDVGLLRYSGHTRYCVLPRKLTEPEKHDVGWNLDPVERRAGPLVEPPPTLPAVEAPEAMNRSPFLLGGRRRVAMRAVHGGSLDRSKPGPENLSAGGALGKLPRDLTEPSKRAVSLS